MAKTVTASIESVYQDLKNRKFAPIYLFTGEEPYYIDQLSDYIENNVLTEDERAFNQSVLYGLDVSAEDIIATAKRFPMMSDYQVVIIKEAQQMKDTDLLVSYINNPFLSAILFTTQFDLTYKLNKKRAVSITEKANTFGNANEVLLDYLASK